MHTHLTTYQFWSSQPPPFADLLLLTSLNPGQPYAHALSIYCFRVLEETEMIKQQCNWYEVSPMPKNIRDFFF